MYEALGSIHSTAKTKSKPKTNHKTLFKISTLAGHQWLMPICLTVTRLPAFLTRQNLKELHEGGAFIPAT
jgi:hypothetical protein